MSYKYFDIQLSFLVTSRMEQNCLVVSCALFWMIFGLCNKNNYSDNSNNKSLIFVWP